MGLLMPRTRSTGTSTLPVAVRSSICSAVPEMKMKCACELEGCFL